MISTRFTIKGTQFLGFPCMAAHFSHFGLRKCPYPYCKKKKKVIKTTPKKRVRLFLTRVGHVRVWVPFNAKRAYYIWHLVPTYKQPQMAHRSIIRILYTHIRTR